MSVLCKDAPTPFAIGRTSTFTPIGGLLISCSTRSIEPFPTYRAIQLKPGHAVLYYKLWHCVQQKHEGRKAIDDYSEANAPENSTLQVSVTRQ